MQLQREIRLRMCPCLNVRVLYKNANTVNKCSKLWQMLNILEQYRHSYVQ